MYSTLISIALLSAFAFRTAHAELVIDTPAELVQCEPVHVTWRDGAAPFDLIVAPDDDRCNGVLADLGDEHKSNSLTWTVDLPVGTQALFSLVDTNGEEAWSGVLTVKSGNNTACLPNASSSAVASPSASDSSAAPSIPATTLSVPASFVNKPASTAAPSSSEAAVPVGAANAGINPLGSGAPAFHKLSGPAVALSALVAVLASLAF